MFVTEELRESVEKYGTKKIKTDHTNRCIVMQNYSVFLFVDHATNQIQKIISDICDPISKPQNIHEFIITDASLLRALALGYTEEFVTNFFTQNIKNKDGVPVCSLQLMHEYLSEIECPQMYLVNHGNQSHYRFVISYRERDKKRNLFDKVQNDYLEKTIEQSEHDPDLYFVKRVRKHRHNQLAQQLFSKNILLKAERKIFPNKQEEISTRALNAKKPLNLCLDIDISLKSFTELREYQAAALNSVVKIEQDYMIAKNGYIVLPCGAGKTLLGISILSKIKKETLIVCTSDSGCQQFKREIEKWTQGFPRQQIIIYTSSSDYIYKNSRNGQIFITTYSCLKSKLKLNKDIKMQNEWMTTKPWGLIIFDECQTLPAEQNSEIMNSLMAKVKIGLTATPLREDDQIKALIYMIGPQLYVGNWKTFVELGFLANPKCIQIRTKLTQTFQMKYEENRSRRDRRQLCYKVNPNKVKALIYLLQYHEELNDSILVFSDDVALIKYLGYKMKRPILRGETKNQQRNVIFDLFREGKVKTLLLSRIGDQAIDLPNANVAIQMNILYSSRRQMLQRLGRIMRQKQASSLTSYNAIFYTIVTAETEQQRYFFNRYRCLIDEGFHYDLRLFEYSDRSDIEDIFRLDPQMKEKVEMKMKQIIEDEERYWEIFAQNQQKNKN